MWVPAQPCARLQVKMNTYKQQFQDLVRAEGAPMNAEEMEAVNLK
jgi:hypothetical protein